MIDTDPVVILVHGLWHQGAHMGPLADELRTRGIDVHTPTLHRGSLEADTAAVQEIIDRLPAPPLVLGHSYGGAVITEASVRTSRVRHLVYLTAFVPDAGESLMDLLGSMPPVEMPLAAAMLPQDDGTSVIDPAGAVAAFYAECEPSVATAATLRLSPQPFATLTQPTTGAGWRTIPSTYVRCTKDQAIDLGHQTHMSTRCGDVRTIETDHSPFASAAEATADILESVSQNVAQTAAVPT